MSRGTIVPKGTPPPARSYSVGMRSNSLAFLPGQTPRDRDNVRHDDKLFPEQARLAPDNLQAAVRSASLSLRDAVKVTVLKRDPSRAKEFDAIYREYAVEPFPAPTLVQSV